MENKNIITFIIVAVVATIVIAIVCDTFEIIPTGCVGVRTKLGEVQDNVIHEGLNTKLPIMEKIVVMNCKTQKGEFTMQTSTKDLQMINNLKIAVNYNVKSDKAVDLYKNVGESYQSILVEPAVYESVKYGTSCM